jgi:CheY-like chemotaxis protein
MDPSQLDQIIMNLCINAKDAIEGRGVIKFRTEKFSFDQQFCDENPEYIPGEFVLLAVEDNGAGMTDTIMSNIFEPFFTTKSAGKGTGLGLSTVYGVVKQNKGFITVSSTHGSGSIFNVYIPFASEEPGEDATMSKKIVSPNARMSGAKDKVILLVEDEPAIMHVCDSILTNLGYTVIKKENPLDAIAFAREYKGKIDLLFTDVIMPEMNGRELADEILTLYPQCVVLFMSGYTADTMLEKGISQLNAGLIRKPFSRNELELRVTEILG